MIIQLMTDADTQLYLIKVTPDLNITSVQSMSFANIESNKLADFMDGKLNMIDFVANDNTGRRTSFILRRF